MSASPSETGYKFPYEDQVKEIVRDLGEYQTRVRPENSREIEEFDLDYGWKAILYEEEEEKGLKDRILDNLAHIAAYNVGYVRATPDYEWELRTPDGNTYRRQGLDLEPEEFGEKIRNFLKED